MNKKIVLIIKSNFEQANLEKARLMKKHIKYSDDFIETNDAIYFIRIMPIVIDMDKILLPPVEGNIDEYNIEEWLEGVEKKIKEIKKITNYSPGNVQSLPPAALNPVMDQESIQHINSISGQIKTA